MRNYGYGLQVPSRIQVLPNKDSVLASVGPVPLE